MTESELTSLSSLSSLVLSEVNDTSGPDAGASSSECNPKSLLDIIFEKASITVRRLRE